MQENLAETVKKAFEGVKVEKKYWALMLFNTELELGISTVPNKWVNVDNKLFTNGTAALEAYANTPNPASQLVDGTSPEDLVQNMEEMIVNYSDENWLNENLYPYL